MVFSGFQFMSKSPSSFVADCCLQQYVKGHIELSYCTIRNFCSQTFMIMKWGWYYVRGHCALGFDWINCVFSVGLSKCFRNPCKENTQFWTYYWRFAYCLQVISDLQLHNYNFILCVNLFEYYGKIFLNGIEFSRTKGPWLMNRMSSFNSQSGNWIISLLHLFKHVSGTHLISCVVSIMKIYRNKPLICILPLGREVKFYGCRRQMLGYYFYTAVWETKYSVLNVLLHFPYRSYS
jgi:hypothetical protein